MRVQSKFSFNKIIYYLLCFLQGNPSQKRKMIKRNKQKKMERKDNKKIYNIQKNFNRYKMSFGQ